MTVIVSVVGEGAVTKTVDIGLHAGSFLKPQGQCHILKSKSYKACSLDRGYLLWNGRCSPDANKKDWLERMHCAKEARR